MGFQDQLSDFISNQLNDYRLSKNMEKAVRSASELSSVDVWFKQERNTVAVTGAASSILPGLHGATMVADIGLLLHKSARLGWGIGALMDCVPCEGVVESDLESILNIWGQKSKSKRENIVRRAIALDLVLYLATAEGREHADSLIEKAERDGQLWLFRTLTVAQVMAYSIKDLKTAKIIEVVATHAATATASRATQTAAKQGVKNTSSTMARRTARRKVTRGISRKVATQTAARFGSRIGARALTGFIPILGAGVAAGLNAWTITTMKDAAVTYYGEALTRNDLSSL